MNIPDLPSSAEPVVAVRGLTKAYDGRTVVDHLDLTVHDGEVLGLIGANGAGKTTTVEILQGLRRQDSGDVRVLGLDPVRDADRVRQQVGSQLQSSGLPDRLRVAEAVDLFSGRRATDGDLLLEQFGLAHRRRSPFAGLSGGERQRLFLVLALLNRPRLVILDELTQGLDPAARRDVWSAISQLHAAGTTVLLVTHELDEAQALVRPGRRDARRAGARPRDPCRAGRPARRRRNGAVHPAARWRRCHRRLAPAAQPAARRCPRRAQRRSGRRPRHPRGDCPCGRVARVLAASDSTGPSRRHPRPRSGAAHPARPAHRRAPASPRRAQTGVAS